MSGCNEKKQVKSTIVTSLFVTAEQFVLVFWPDENAVSSVCSSNVDSWDSLRVGQKCRVRTGLKTYEGIAALIG